MIPFIESPNLTHIHQHIHQPFQLSTTPPPLPTINTKYETNTSSDSSKLYNRLPSDSTSLYNRLRSIDVIWHYIFWLGIYVSSITGYWILGVEVVLVLVGVLVF
jgi:hypothetical protein